ncbi:hypothetical protein AEM42_11495 [Betaproteobacteria bacterium UKL13-2]|nr:hypothetical protein AEM42_11495 [Betaproteobacteria bacterium UKL13-2]HCG52863.1 hypothetical protein [Betaproteobacteria bacterium]
MIGQTGLRRTSVGVFVEHVQSISQAIAVVGPQLRIAQSEIGRMRGIIDNAASELLISFGEIQSAVMQSEVAVGNTADAAIARAMTALQFQDMVAQMMSGLSQRIGAATEMLDGAVTSDGTSCATFPRQVVLQQDVAAGDIELF